MPGARTDLLRWAALAVALSACEGGAAPPAPPPPRWLYPPRPLTWPWPVVTGRLGRGQAPQLAGAAGIVGDPTIPLRLPTPWAVPGEGPARAIVYGTAGDRPAVELIDVDGGQVRWRDTTSCGGPVVGVTDDVVVCADARGTAAIGLDGKPRWHKEVQFLAITGEQLAVGSGEGLAVLDAATGDELAAIQLPASIPPETINAVCADDLWAIDAGGRLGRIVQAAPASAPAPAPRRPAGKAAARPAPGPAIAWTTPFGGVTTVDACDEVVLVMATTAQGEALIALDRKTGSPRGRVDGARGFWPARDGSADVEVATDGGVRRWPRSLTGDGAATGLPPLRGLISRSGDRRLVRVTPLTAAVLDRAGLRGYVALAEMSAVVGDQALVAASWTGSFGETVHRRMLPPRRPLRVAAAPHAAALPVAAELRDLPAVVPVDVAAAAPRPGVGMHAVGAVVVDPGDPAILYAVTLERQPDVTSGAGVSRFDLRAGTWSWDAPDACGAGTPVAIAVTGDVVVCGAHGSAPGTAVVRAIGRDGRRRWEWKGDNLDALQAAGDLVLIHDADRLEVLAAADGRTIARFASDDGGLIRAVVTAGAVPRLVVVEHGRLVARLAGAELLPEWSIAVDGVVRGLAPAGDGVLVELEDGDAYAVGADGGISPVAGIGLAWRALGELITGAAELTDGWQLALHELGGAVRVRNDYALAAPRQLAAARGPGAPVVIGYGAALREVLVVDPRTGDPTRRVRLPDDAPPGLSFATVVDGRPVTGALLASPLRVVRF